MKFTKTLAILLAALLAASCFSGCGAANDYAAAGEITYAYNSELKSESADDSSLVIPGESGSGSSGSTSASSQTARASGQKLIRTWYLEAETEDMDTLLSGIVQQVSQLEGYVEAREIYNGSAYNSSRYRNASLTVRIPAQKLEEFISAVGQVSNITSSREEAEDVTLTYVATQSRITALETEQTRLLELLAQAETMEDLLLIESRLTEVRTELEQVTSQLRLYDNLVDYGTVYLTLTEVRQYTVVEEPESVWARMSKGFVESLKNLGNGLTEFAVFVVSNLPYLLLIALIGAAVACTVCLILRKKRKKAQ